MSIAFNQLIRTLGAKVYPVYLLSGDEEQLLHESCQLVLASLVKQDFCMEQKFVVSAHTDWQLITQSMVSGSLFSEKRVFVLNIESSAFSADLSRLVDHFIQHHGGQHVLLICMAKIAKKDQSRKCYKAIDSAGLIVQLWPLRSHEWRVWMQHHCQAMGLSCDPPVLDLIASATEGDLAAAKQCLEKFKLVFNDTRITVTAARAHLVEQTKYQAYELMLHCLAGRTEKVIKVLDHYRKKENEMNLLLWFVSRDLQLLHQLLHSQSRDAVYKKNNIWPSRKQPYDMALQRMDAGLLAGWMADAAHLDRCLKSEGKWLVWDALAMLLICMTQSKPSLLAHL